MKAFAPGIYPRSEALVQATRDLDRGRTTPEAVDTQVERDLEELVSVQQAAGLDPLTERYVAPLPGPRLVTLPSPSALAHGTDVSPKAMAEGVLKPAIEGLEAE